MSNASKPWAANRIGQEFKGSYTDLPDSAKCRGDLAEGTGCGKCAKCRKAWPDVFKPQATVHEFVGDKLKYRWGPFDNAVKAEQATRTKRKIETAEGKVFAIVVRATILL